MAPLTFVSHVSSTGDPALRQIVRTTGVKSESRATDIRIAEIGEAKKIVIEP